MTQPSNLKSFFLQVFLLLGIVGLGSSFLQAGPTQTPIVLGFSQRISVETLFRYCAMEKNPFYLEREKRRVEQEARLQLLLEKRGEDLTPFQQIELLKHTFDLRFADAIAAKTLKAFIFAWVLFEGIEFAWRIHCREQHNQSPDGGWFEKKTSFGIKMDASNDVSDSPTSSQLYRHEGTSPVDAGFLKSSSHASSSDGCVPSRLSSADDAVQRKISEYEFQGPQSTGHYACRAPESLSGVKKTVPEHADRRTNPRVKKEFSRHGVFLEELTDIASPLRKRLEDFVFRVKSKNAQSKIQENQHAYGFDVIGRPVDSERLRPDIAKAQQVLLSERFRLGAQAYPFTVTSWHEYKKKPPRLEHAMTLLNYGIKLGPGMMLFGGMLWRLVRGNNQTAESFLDRLFKNFSSEYVAGFGGKDHKKYLLDVLIAPLWKKHRGNENNICAELAQMGEKLRMLQGALVAGSTNHKTLYSLVMGVHGGVLPFEHTRLLGRINKAFEQGIVNRGIKAGLATLSVVSAQVLLRALVARRVGESIGKISDYALPISCALFTYWTLKECVTKAWNHDNKQARKDYDIFLNRLELEKQQQYTESFYWAWFYPMWRAHKRDVLEVESCFFNRVDEVKKLFDTRVPA